MADSFGMFLSPIQISPWSGLRIPMMCFRKTLLPVPEGPSISVIRPFGMSQLMSSRTVCGPKDLVSSLIEISVSTCPFPASPRPVSCPVCPRFWSMAVSVLATDSPSDGPLDPVRGRRNRFPPLDGEKPS